MVRTVISYYLGRLCLEVLYYDYLGRLWLELLYYIIYVDYG